ncbi:TetR/AcrR family transcriptional regulator [Rhodococcus sp. IEGM 1379]|uniref:TetR/AcrR family transcriptional regulator n=1 Tax=Rhodococcus sp. IEGM 1379 TaxID=3047086 RepID=UPI0024B7BB48|nr:TetR/AcrR family transcriptional regulator [Rhodococcus sp. IEGM 1379]MDI9916582.1 TetR/AcrR family transcriptional regulator [Rhodococcus sp. IEGM 1379]
MGTVSTATEGSKGKRGTLRDEQKRATRAKLVDAARTLFEERGYAAVTVDDIASVVGCSRATFYVHFPSRVEMLKTIGAAGMATSALASYMDLDEVLDSGSRAEFTAWLEKSFDWFDENKRLLPAWDEAVALEPEFRITARDGISGLPDAMPKYLARWPADQQDEARLRVELLVTQLERFFTRWAVQGTIDVTRAQAAEVLTDIWFPALYGNPPAPQ